MPKTAIPPGGLGQPIIKKLDTGWEAIVRFRNLNSERAQAFSSSIIWNNFPVPNLTDSQRAEIIQVGQGVLDAREQHPNRSLADYYAPLTMAPELVKAHKTRDRLIDRAFGASKLLTSEKARLELLFENYQALANSESSARGHQR